MWGKKTLVNSPIRDRLSTERRHGWGRNAVSSGGSSRLGLRRCSIPAPVVAPGESPEGWLPGTRHGARYSYNHPDTLGIMPVGIGLCIDQLLGTWAPRTPRWFLLGDRRTVHRASGLGAKRSCKPGKRWPNRSAIMSMASAPLTSASVLSTGREWPSFSPKARNVKRAPFCRVDMGAFQGTRHLHGRRRRLHLRPISRCAGRLQGEHRRDAAGAGVPVGERVAGIGPGRVHVRGHPVGDDPLVGPVLRPFGDRIDEVPAQHPFERRDLAGLVQAAQKVVEGAVLEHEHDHVVDGVFHGLAGHPHTHPSGPRDSRTGGHEPLPPRQRYPRLLPVRIAICVPYGSDSRPHHARRTPWRP